MNIKLALVSYLDDNIKRQFYRSQGLKKQFRIEKNFRAHWDLYSDYKLADLGFKGSDLSDPAHALVGAEEFEKLKSKAIVNFAEDKVHESDGEDCATLYDLIDWIITILTFNSGVVEFNGNSFSLLEMSDDFEAEDDEPYESA